MCHSFLSLTEQLQMFRAHCKQLSFRKTGSLTERAILQLFLWTPLLSTVTQRRINRSVLHLFSIVYSIQWFIVNHVANILLCKWSLHYCSIRKLFKEVTVLLAYFFFIKYCAKAVLPFFFQCHYCSCVFDNSCQLLPAPENWYTRSLPAN